MKWEKSEYRFSGIFLNQLFEDFFVNRTFEVSRKARNNAFASSTDEIEPDLITVVEWLFQLWTHKYRFLVFWETSKGSVSNIYY